MAVAIPFVRELSFEYGVMQQVSPLIRRVVARNPSPFTFRGTGTYIVGHGRVAVIDPGPDLAEHVDAIAGSLRGEEISHLVVTHTHRDHSPACRPLQTICGAPTYAFGPHGGSDEPGVKVEEGVDRSFSPDVRLDHGDIIQGEGWSLECVHTPGHTSNHMSYQLREERALFSGDHVMGWSTSVISPPDGNMRDYMASLQLLLERDDAVFWPTHGPSINDPKPFVRAFIAHRRERERQILDCVARGLETIEAMVPVIYTTLPVPLYPAAARSVFAAIIYLVETERLVCSGAPTLDKVYQLP